MSLRRYFKPANKLPTAEETGLPTNVLKEVNQVVSDTVDRSGGATTGRKIKYTTTFSAEDRAAIGRYAAENTFAGHLCFNAVTCNSVLLKAHPDKFNFCDRPTAIANI